MSEPSPKISFIMQSYLGSYPGSRSNSDAKFLRAVKSFLDQRDTGHELIIASDGCDITHGLWKSELKGKPGLKYVYVDKDKPNMYESIPGEPPGRYLRGLPRQVARSLVTGEVTTYMDSDDILMHNATIILRTHWARHLRDNPDKMLIAFTHAWYDNVYSLSDNFKSNTGTPGNITKDRPVKIAGLESEWVVTSLNEKKDPTARGGIPVTWLMSHKSDLTVRWKDTYQVHGAAGNTGEDNIFGLAMIDEAGSYKHIMHIREPYYVRLHYTNAWDF